MSNLPSILLVTAIALWAVYIHALVMLHQIVWTEQPSWVERRGLFSRSFDQLPRFLDPSVSLAMHAIAFSSRISRLRSPLATMYARRFRFGLVGCAILVGAASFLGAA
jgi:hypothetical protein